MTATNIEQATTRAGKTGEPDGWRGFKGLIWRDTGPTERTTQVWHRLGELFPEEREKGVLDVSLIPSSITAHDPGYIDKDRELIVGLQTDAPLKRAIMPNGGLRMVETSVRVYGYPMPPAVHEIFTKSPKSHNQGVLARIPA
jgi:formate C-acetyltransferase